MPARLTCLGVLLLALLSACGTPPLATPAPTPEPVFLTYPSELRPYADKLAACGRTYPDISLFLTESVTEPVPDGQTSLFLAIGSVPTPLSSWQATLLADDSLAVIVNAYNPLEALTTDELRLIWSGKTLTWAELGGSEGEVQVWVYPNGSALRTFFDSAIMGGELISSRAWLAPDPQAVLEAVAADPDAIAALPLAWLDSASPELAGSVKRIQLADMLNENLHQPVIALTEADPQGALRTLLLCFQQALKP